MRVLVFVDQLEELFTLADDDERQRFIATLREQLLELIDEQHEPRGCGASRASDPGAEALREPVRRGRAGPHG